MSFQGHEEEPWWFAKIDDKLSQEILSSCKYDCFLVTLRISPNHSDVQVRMSNHKANSFVICKKKTILEKNKYVNVLVEPFGYVMNVTTYHKY